MERARVAAVAVLALTAMAAADATPTGTTTTTTAPVATVVPDSGGGDRPPMAQPPASTTTSIPSIDTTWRATAGFTVAVGIVQSPLPPSNPWVRMAEGLPAPPSTEISLFRRMAPFGTVVPMLAADPEPPPAVEDGGRWIADVRLRRDINWSDGTPVSARDVAFSFRQANVLGITEPAGHPLDGAGQQTLIDVSPVADHTVRFVWSERPIPSQWPLGSALAPIHPEHHWMPLVGDARSIEELDAATGIGAPSAAAYRLAAGDESRLLLRAVEGHWEGGAVVVARTDGTIEYRNPRLRIDERYGPGSDGEVVVSWTLGPFAERIEFSVFDDQQGALLALAEGRVDLVLPAGGIEPNLAAVLGGNPRIRHLVSPLPDPTGLTIEPDGTVASLPAVPAALDCLFDRDRLSIQTGGRILPAVSVFPGGWGGWAPSPVPTCSGDEGDRLTESVRLLTAAGWSWDVAPGIGEDGLVPGRAPTAPDGRRPGRIVVSAPRAIDDPIAALVAGEAVRILELLGLDVSLGPPGRNADVTLETVRIGPEPWGVTEALGLDPSTPQARRLHLSGSTAEAASAAADLIDAATPRFVPLYRATTIEAIGADVDIPITSVGGLLTFSGALESLRPVQP